LIVDRSQGAKHFWLTNKHCLLHTFPHFPPLRSRAAISISRAFSVAPRDDDMRSAGEDRPTNAELCSWSPCIDATAAMWHCMEQPGVDQCSYSRPSRFYPRDAMLARLLTVALCLSDMELGHWVTGSMGHLGHLSRPGHRVIILIRCETRVFPAFEKMPRMQNLHLKC